MKKSIKLQPYIMITVYMGTSKTKESMRVFTDLLNEGYNILTNFSNGKKEQYYILYNYNYNDHLIEDDEESEYNTKMIENFT